MYCNTTLFQKRVSNESNPIVLIDENGNKKAIGHHPYDPQEVRTNISYTKKSPLLLKNGYFLYFTQTNVAHSISQLIISLYEIISLDNTPNLYLSKCIVSMPFLHKLIPLLFKTDKITILDDDTLYKCENIYIPPYIWFYGDYEEKYTYDSINNVRIFTPLERNNSKFKNHMQYFNKIIEDVYLTHCKSYKTYDSICIIKSQLSTDSTTPQRSMILSDNVVKLLEKNGFHFFLPHTITDIIEYIVLMKSAKNIISSYGGAQCVNRFFYTNANVKVLCNKHYESEYKKPWHNAISLFKSINTFFFLDIENTISETKIQDIIKYNIT